VGRMRTCCPLLQHARRTASVCASYPRARRARRPDQVHELAPQQMAAGSALVHDAAS
jgi:hypothetical protein